jgi:cytochrome b561
MAVRLVARWRGSPPPLPEAIGPQQQRAARLAHALLYALLIALPLSGWLMASASPLAWPIELPGGTSVPLLAALANLPEPAKAVWFERLRAAHGVLAWVLIALAGLHIAAALRHGRAVLRRMRLP